MLNITIKPHTHCFDMWKNPKLAMPWQYSAFTFTISPSVFCLLSFVQRNKTHQIKLLFMSIPHSSYESIHLFSFQCRIFHLKSVGVYIRNAPFHFTGGCGCCCNPQDAEHHGISRLLPSSPHALASSFPHPHHTSADLPTRSTSPISIRKLLWWASACRGPG